MVSKEISSDHEPVLTEQVVRFLATNPGGAYLDLTVGAGGHLKALSQAVGRNARLYGLDKDATAVELAGKNLAGRPQLKTIVNESYHRLEAVVERLDDSLFDGILLDLGISSMQLDDPKRGFSFRFEGPLDMRFDPASSGPAAADLINKLSEKELADIIKNFGEQAQARRLARAIVRERQEKMILTTTQLKQIILGVIKPPYQNKALARVFQAFRIAVNRELELLAETLPIAASLLAPKGRLAVISYHSLEDRAVKRFFQRGAKGCTCPPEFDVCMCGTPPTLKIITRKPVMASEEEQNANPRSRSARLRVAQRLES